MDTSLHRARLCGSVFSWCVVLVAAISAGAWPVPAHGRTIETARGTVGERGPAIDDGPRLGSVAGAPNRGEPGPTALAPTPRVETWIDLPATVFLPGRADPRTWMSTGTWARVTYDGFNYDYGYDPLAQTYDMLVSGYAVDGGIIVQETVGVMATATPTTVQAGQVERVECWFLVSQHNLYPDEWVGITALEDDYEPSSSLNSLEARLLYEDARGFRGTAYAVDHFAAGGHAIDLGPIAVDDLEQAMAGRGWFGVGFAADGWDLSGSLGVQVFWRVSGGGGLPENNRPFFRVVYNAPPGPFYVTAPGTGSLVSVERPWLYWSEAVDPNGDGPVTYRVALSTTPDFQDTVEFEVTGVTGARPPLALTSGTYYWRVDARDPFGARRVGPTSSFVVAMGTPAPSPLHEPRISCSPNPFNPRTQIRLELPHAATVPIDVLDLRGRVVRRLVIEAAAAGVHDVVWDGVDERGERCASGVYEIRARLDDRTLRSRVTLLE